MLKKLVSLLCLTAVLIAGSAFVFEPGNASASIKSSIQPDTEGITKEVDEAGSKLISTIREVAIVVAFILIVWIGASLWFSGSVQALVNMKVRLGSFIIALLFSFKTEAIMSFLFGLFSIEI
ncbi:hypothetical protein [Cytobacillus sp. IB215665]|uniref:hypothetical protein n=1 Tax=Cytobacillus sp. IB215665 TaxID=3097357 RepID=UPI002A1555F1|nr:hypothetical protein [Cytobacillus sp. IB215665]MDX8367178.1 hypothetical protein [Cytobacillus sp. IB215665]